MTKRAGVVAVFVMATIQSLPAFAQSPTQRAVEALDAEVLFGVNLGVTRTF
ncbi:MAG: hypothetical protein JWP87_1007 [Labilithrix sp.]|nr:hypothetical protein [Labilithrix sp.]